MPEKNNHLFSMAFRRFSVRVADPDRIVENLAAAIGILCRLSGRGGQLCLCFLVPGRQKGRTVRYAPFDRPITDRLKGGLRGHCALGHDHGGKLGGFKRFGIFHVAPDALIQLVP